MQIEMNSEDRSSGVTHTVGAARGERTRSQHGARLHHGDRGGRRRFVEAVAISTVTLIAGVALANTYGPYYFTLHSSAQVSSASNTADSNQSTKGVLMASSGVFSCPPGFSSGYGSNGYFCWKGFGGSQIRLHGWVVIDTLSLCDSWDPGLWQAFEIFVKSGNSGQGCSGGACSNSAKLRVYRASSISGSPSWTLVTARTHAPSSSSTYSTGSISATNRNAWRYLLIGREDYSGIDPDPDFYESWMYCKDPF